MWHFDFDGERWAAVHTGDLHDGTPVPLRIESACLFGHVLRSAQCDCGYQLDEAMHTFARQGRGLLLYGIDQDARGLGIAAHFAIYAMRQQEGLDTEAVYRRLDAPVDARSYEPVAAILRHLGVDSVRLLSNNRRRETFLQEAGFTVERAPLEAPLDVHNMSTLMLEKEDLDYAWSFETHADWLRPLQESVLGSPGRSRAYAVVPGSGTAAGPLAAAEDDGEWRLAEALAAAMPAELPAGPLVVYLTDLPRTDELAVYAGLGAAVVVVPFAELPEPLRRAAAAAGVRLVDWERGNAYPGPRPQWRPTASPTASPPTCARTGSGWCRPTAPRPPSTPPNCAAAAPRSGTARSGGTAGGSSCAPPPTRGGPPPTCSPSRRRPTRRRTAMTAATTAGPGAGTTRAVSRAEGLALGAGDGLLIDTCQAAPASMRRFATMNPFHRDRRWRIPVPGTAQTSQSLENVWQALKLVDGRTDLSLLARPAEKRPPDHLRGPGFDYAASTVSFAGRPTDLVTARYLVYLPAYLHVLDRLVPDAVVAEITGALAAAATPSSTTGTTTTTSRTRAPRTATRRSSPPGSAGGSRSSPTGGRPGSPPARGAPPPAARRRCP
ncbi:DUF6939 family protein [Kitasatospora arboriphila]